MGSFWARTSLSSLIGGVKKQSQITRELRLARGTGVDWDSFCREVCEVTMFDNSEKIAGEGKIVQIDESKFGKRKYHRGHHVEGQ